MRRSAAAAARRMAAAPTLQARAQVAHWMNAVEQTQARRYWKYGPLVALSMLMIVCVRVHELIRPLSILRPVLLITVVGGTTFFARTHVRILRAAFRYRPTQILLAYCLWAVVTVPFALWQAKAFEAVMGFPMMFLLYLFFVMCAPTRANMDKMTLVFVIAVAAFSAGGLVFGDYTTEAGRLMIGVTYDPNDLACLLALSFPFVLGQAARRKGFQRLMMLSLGLPILAAIVASESRGGLLALVAGGIAFGLGQKASKKFLLVVLLVVGSIVGWFASPQAFRDRMASMMALKQDYNFQTYDGRIAVWKRGFGYTLQHPITGVGAANFDVAEGDWLHGMVGKWSTAHNSYLQALAEFGFVGGAIFLLMLGTMARRTIVAWRPRAARFRCHRPEFFSALVAYCVGAFFLSLAYSHIIFGLLGLLTIIDRTVRAEMDRGRLLARMPMMATGKASAGASIRTASPPSQGPIPLDGGSVLGTVPPVA
jgi:O-antigen ligase